MAKTRYRLRNLVYMYHRYGVRSIAYYSADELNRMLLKVKSALGTLRTTTMGNGKTLQGGSAFTLQNKKALKELKHYLEIKILEKTILANKNGD